MAMRNDGEGRDYRQLIKDSLIELERLQCELDTMRRAQSEPIAVIGMGCRFPAGANTPRDFWAMLRDGVDAIGEVPPERWNLDAYYDSDEDAPGKVYCRRAGLVDQSEVEAFSADFFGIAPREAERMDPQQRMLLEVCWESLEDAAVPPDRVKGSRTGLFVGSCTDDYLHLVNNLADPAGIDGYTSLGTARCITVGRVSYLLGLEGPAVQLDTACSSSLVAVHQACGSLRSGECAMALAGGVNLQLSPVWTLGLSKLKALSPDGRCKTFDARANGFVRGEGCGMVVLKRLADAVEEGDRVLALIRGTAVNHDGRSSGLTVPSQPAQEKLLRQALQSAGLRSDQIDYLEAHGTGTSLGDPIEMGALASVFAGRQEPLWVGSVKTNIGHLEGAAGIAGLVKVILALEREEIPPHLHFEQPNPHIPWNEFPVRIPTERTPWPRGGRRRLAGVSSFGFSGTNAHLIVEEAPPAEPGPKAQRDCHLLPISAKSEEALRALGERYAADIEADESPALSDLCFTAGTGRSHFDHRLAVVAETGLEACERLRAFTSGEEAEGCRCAKAEPGEGNIAFLFSGDGSEYAGMGRRLHETEPVFRAAMDECDEILRADLPRRLSDVIYGDREAAALVHEAPYAGPSLFALEYALGRLWQSWGIQPSVVIGQGAGEYAAACLAGVFSPEDGLKLVATRGRLMQALTQDGTPAAGSLLDDFRAVADEVTYARPQRKLIFSVTGQAADEEVARAEHWCRHVLRPARLREGMTGLFLEGVRTFVEVGPGSTLLELGRSCWQSASRRGDPRWLPSLDPRRSDSETLLGSLAELYVTGQAVDWAGFGRRFAGRKISLPTYPFQRRRYWLEPSSAVVSGRPAASGRRVHPLLGRRIHSAAAAEWAQFESHLGGSQPAYLADHGLGETVVFPATACLEMALSAGREAEPNVPTAIEDVVFQHAMTLPQRQTRTVQLVLKPEQSGYRFELFSRRCVCDDEPGRAPQWTRHASGRVVPSAPEQEAPAVSLEELRAECPEEVPPRDVYARIAAQGFRYGPTFQSLRHLWRGRRQALGYVEVPKETEGGTEPYWFHPALLDGCLHAIGGMAETESQETLVPTGLERMEVFSRPAGPLWSHVSLRETEGPGFTADVALIDPEGTLVARLQGLRMQEVDRRRLLDRQEAASDEWLYELAWHESPAGGESAAMGAGQWLVLADEGGVGRRLARRLAALDQRCVLARPGDRFQAPAAEKEGPAEYGIRPGSVEDFQRLLQRGFAAGPPEAKETPRLRGVIHLWSLGMPSDEAEAFSSAHRLSCGSALCLVQALSGKRPSPRVWLVTRGGHSVGEARADTSYLAQAPLWGLGRVIAMEHPELRSVRVDLDPQADCDAQADALLSELTHASDEGQIAYRRGTRHAARLVRLSESPQTPLSISDGSYLVTGGLGALGLQVARWLVDRGARHLVLSGRKGPSTSEQRQALRQLRLRGADVRVLPADVSDAEQVGRLVESIRSTLPRLRGVVHAAGQLDDGMLRHQDWSRFERVMRPKVAGAWHLHRLTSHLDFFVVFSSAVGLLGSPGQGNYAAANVFLDALAQYRQASGEPGLSIAWGPWSDLGMTARMARRDRDRMAEIGLHPIGLEEGLTTLGRLIQSELPYVAAARIDWDRLAASIPVCSCWVDLASASGPLDRRPSAVVVRLREAPAGERLRILTEQIRGEVANVLGRASPDSIGTRKRLFDLGMDSLMSVELQRRLEKGLGVSLPLTLAFDYPNVEALAGYVFERLDLGAPEPAAEGRDEERLQSRARRLAAMSEQQVEALLAEKYKELL